MFAVIKTGGKQYKVASGDVLTVEKLAADAGETVQFNDVLMLGGESTTVGSPTVDGAAVQAEVLEQGRGPKLLNLKRRRRKHSSRRLKGHRQYLTTVKVTDILAAGADATGVKAALGAASAGAIAAAAPAAEPKAVAKEDSAAEDIVETAAEAPVEDAAAAEPAVAEAAPAAAEDTSTEQAGDAAEKKEG